MPKKPNSLLEQWLSSRDSARPFTGNVAALSHKAIVNPTVIYDASWGNYKTIPAALERYIDQKDNERFRADQRRLFTTLELDWPVPFAGFRNLAAFWDSSFASISKAFCLQRPVLMKFDRCPTLLFSEINEVMALVSPPNYLVDVFIPYCQNPHTVQPLISPPKKGPLDFLEELKARRESLSA